jgi:hypothetical protein
MQNLHTFLLKKKISKFIMKLICLDLKQLMVKILELSKIQMEPNIKLIKFNFTLQVIFILNFRGTYLFWLEIRYGSLNNT